MLLFTSKNDQNTAIKTKAFIQIKTNILPVVTSSRPKPINKEKTKHFIAFMIAKKS